MLKSKFLSVLTGAAAVGAPIMTRSKLGLAAIAAAGVLAVGAPGAFAT